MSQYRLDGRLPQSIAAHVWLAPMAQVIGNVVLGREASIWFSAIVRGDGEPIMIGDVCLIGIGAVILNRASIGERSIVGANALVTEAKQFPTGALIIGAPARAVRELTTLPSTR